MAKTQVYCRLRKTSAVAGNANAQIVLDRATGRMAELTVTRKRFGRWNVEPGWLEVVDELTQKTYRDGRSAARVRVDRISTDDGPALRVRKKFNDAAFTVTETWAPTKTEIHWSVSVALTRGGRARSIQIRQFIPWPNEPYPWKVWTAQQDFPKLAAHVGHNRIVYGDVCFGTVVPIASVYNENRDVGLSIAKPFGLKVPQWGFAFGTYRFGGVTAESALVGLRPKRDAHVSLMLRAHEGCWRPGLGWLVRKYPEYFKPGNPATPETIEGGFMGGDPFSTPKNCRASLRYGAKVVEVHCGFEHYGDYYPDKESWKTIHWLEFPASAKRRKLPNNSPERMNRTMEMFRRMGIVPLPYIQLAGDGWKPWVEKRFPESIAMTREGRPSVPWPGTWLMNSDPSLPFGKWIDEQLDRFFDRHGQTAGGIFWDQPCYDDIDVAHDDGITMLDNKPAYRLVFCYEKHAQKMVAELKRRKMFLYANGPVYIELCRGIDAIMAEGVSWTADVDQYMCAARPMCFYSYFKPDDAIQLEKMLQKCLLLGGSCYSTHPVKYRPDMVRLYDVYRPLIDRLRGRTFCFDANPIDAPLDVQANIFRGGDGNVYVPIITSMLRAAEARQPKRDLKLEVRLPDAARYRKATAQATTYTGDRPVRLQRNGRRMTLTLRTHHAASLICLHRAPK